MIAFDSGVFIKFPDKKYCEIIITDAKENQIIYHDLPQFPDYLFYSSKQFPRFDQELNLSCIFTEPPISFDEGNLVSNFGFLDYAPPK